MDFVHHWALNPALSLKAWGFGALSVPQTPKLSNQWTTPALPDSRFPVEESKYKTDRR